MRFHIEKLEERIAPSKFKCCCGSSKSNKSNKSSKSSRC